MEYINFKRSLLTWENVRTSNILAISRRRLRSSIQTSTCFVHLVGSWVAEVCFDSTFPHFRVKMKGAYKQRRERMQELMTKEFTKIGFPSMIPRQKQRVDDGLMGVQAANKGERPNNRWLRLALISGCRLLAQHRGTKGLPFDGEHEKNWCSFTVKFHRESNVRDGVVFFFWLFFCETHPIVLELVQWNFTGIS